MVFKRASGRRASDGYVRFSSDASQSALELAAFSADKYTFGARLCAVLGGWLAILWALWILAGWVVGKPWWGGLYAGRPLMPLMALALGLQGAALLLALVRGKGGQGTRRTIILAFALTPACLGLLFLLENVWQRDIGVDMWLFGDQLQRLGILHPGRPSVQSMFPMMLDGLALALLDAPSRRRVHPAELCAIASAILPLLALAGYALQATAFYSLSFYEPMPLPAALARSLLSFCILCARPARGLMAFVTGPGAGARLWRRLLPVLIVVPAVCARLELAVVQSRRVDYETANAGAMVLCAAVTLGVAYWSAGQVQRAGEAQERMFAELELQERRFHGVIASAPDGVLLANGAGKIVLVNARVEQLFGYGPGEMLGLPIERLVPVRIRDDQARLREAIDKTSAERTPSTVLDLQAIRRDGTEFPVNVGLSTTEGPDGLRYVAFIRDLSAQQQALAEVAQRTAELHAAEELGRLKDHLLSTISHELRTPLTLVTGYTELLEESHPKNALLAGVLDGSRRLAEHITQILDLAALTAGTLTLSKSEVDLHELVEVALAMTAEEFATKQIVPTVQLDEALPFVEGDLHRLIQVLVALLRNAIQFTPEGGQVALSVSATDAQVRLAVADSGVGIPACEHERIWTAFNQVGSGDATHTSGLGLGLAIVKGLVQLHGGHVELASECGSGTTCSVFLPVAPASA